MSRKVDSKGRLWVLEEFDKEALRQRVEAYDARHDEPTDDPYPGIGYARYLPRDEGGRFGIPVGFTTTYCDGETKVGWDAEYTRFTANHSNDPLEPSGRPFNNRAEKFVVLGGGTICSGTIMDSNNILTAAHCILDDDWDLQDVTAVSACTYANDDCSGSECSVPSGRAVDCAGGDSIAMFAPMSAEADVDDDFAVIKLASRLSEVRSGVIDEMYMSKRSTSLEGFGAHTRGYPGGTPDASNPCTDNDSLNPALSSRDADGAGTSARVQYLASGDAYDVISDEIRFLMSTSTGMSGGAMYYCWETDCEDGHGQTSIQSYYDTFHVRGPRSADFRSAVLAAV